MAKTKDKTVSKLSDAELFYIRKNPDGLTAQELADNLDKSLAVVERVLVEELARLEKEIEAQKKREETPMRKMFGRHERKDVKVATVMTPGAAQLADELKKSLKKKKDNTSYVHKPFNG